ncbi:MAG TPA: fluoride efflux transporter CrcB [Nocardioides bacterium]|uniref:fluoride efflux transporter FluC n=1 Tax=uncultured Nocardioides sp. TaxID=198441 RepID=UPI000EC3D7BC|nr:CrcB family protein [uncultured Nocardioides sp.]HCB04829.1 fluoride efflux transporter CrcB [Nocardioides sp.]
MTVLLVALGAALGAPLRFAVASALDEDRFPWGTLAVNVTGSFLLGLFVALGASGGWLALLGTGFCGGFTTYSAFAVQTHRLGGTRAAAYAGVTVGLALAACALGFVLGA